MKKILFVTLFGVIGLISCSTVESTVIEGENILNYRYLIWETNTQNNGELEYINFDIYDALKSSQIKIISKDSLSIYPANETLIVQCHISSDKFISNDAVIVGRYARANTNLKEKLFISVNFKNAKTNLPVFYAKCKNNDIPSLKRRIINLLMYGNKFGVGKY